MIKRLITSACTLAWVGSAVATPVLQLDIAGGSYNKATQTTDFAEKPPDFGNCLHFIKNAQKNFALGCPTTRLSGAPGLFWWCFQLLIYDQFGFFSRITTMAGPSEDGFTLYALQTPSASFNSGLFYLSAAVVPKEKNSTANYWATTIIHRFRSGF